MKVTFTRHAEQRIKLYAIDRAALEERVNAIEAASLPQLEKSTFLFDGIKSKVNKVIKLVLVREVEEIVVITVYPLKRGLNL